MIACEEPGNARSGVTGGWKNWEVQRFAAAAASVAHQHGRSLWRLVRMAADGAREAAIAIPRLVELLRATDQLECCKVLRTLAGIGPAAQDAVSAIIELANDPDYLIRQQARAALRAIAPE